MHVLHILALSKRVHARASKLHARGRFGFVYFWPGKGLLSKLSLGDLQRESFTLASFSFFSFRGGTIISQVVEIEFGLSAPSHSDLFSFKHGIGTVSLCCSFTPHLLPLFSLDSRVL